MHLNLKIQKRIFNNQIQRNKTMFKHLHHILLSISIFFAQTNYAMESNFPKEEVSNNNVTETKPDETLVQRLALHGKELNAQKLKNELNLATAPAKFSFYEKFIAARLAKIARMAFEHPKKFTVLSLVLRELLQTPSDKKNGSKKTKLEKTNEEPHKNNPSSFIKELTKPYASFNTIYSSSPVCTVSSNNKTLFVLNIDNFKSKNSFIDIWDIAKQNLLSTIYNPKNYEQEWSPGLKISSDNKMLFSCSRVIEIWDVSDLGNPKFIAIFDEQSRKESTEWIWDLAISSNNQILCSASDRNTIKIWNISNIKNPSLINTIDKTRNGGHTQVVKRLALSTDNKILFSFSIDNTMKIWNISDHKKPTLINTYDCPYGNWDKSITVSTDNKMLFLTIGSQSIILNVSNLAEITMLADLSHLGETQILSSDFKTLAVLTSDSITVGNFSDIISPTLLKATESTKFPSKIRLLFTIKDNNKLVFQTEQKTIIIWDYTQIYAPNLTNYFARLPQGAQGIIEYFFINEIIAHKKNQIKYVSTVSTTKPLILINPLLIQLFEQLPKKLQDEMIRKKYVIFMEPAYNLAEHKVSGVDKSEDSQNDTCTVQ